jgi:NAD(P)H-nitrite reductase large subunit
MGQSYVIIGDGIAGSSAAETLREREPESDVTVVTDEGEALYNRILIKEYAKGKMPEAPISIHEPDWYAERDIDLELNTHVTRVDTDAKRLETHDGDAIEYDRLLVAAGGTPAQLPVPNSDAEGIHHFWTFQDARKIQAAASEAETGAVIGAGLLGIDLAAVCGAHEIDAHYLMRGESWWRYALSPDGAEIIHEGLRSKGVTPVFETGVEGFETDDGRVTGAIGDDGTTYDAEFVGVAIGLDFNLEPLAETPIERDNGIIVDAGMRTSVDDVYAAGDITQFHDVILGDRAQNGSWGSAKEQGRIAAINMVADGDDPMDQRDPEGGETFRWVSSYSITHFDFPFLSFGHPTLGDGHVERRYSESEWRRIALQGGRIVGGVLIGDLAPQSALKQLAREQRVVGDNPEALLAESVDPDDFAPAPEA